MWASSTIVLLSLASLQTTRSASSSAWHLDTLNILVNERLDPIVSPNGVSSHTHMVMGGANFGASYNYATSMAAKCSSASVQADKSNYWTPKLFWVNNASSFTPIPSSHRFYYFLHDPSPNQVVSPFPPGLRMLIGDPNSKSPNTKDFQFLCHSQANTGSDQSLDNFNFPTDCINGLKLEFNFPNCWDGVNLYKSDMSHMTREISGNQCPLTHPVKLPSIMLESTYATSSVSPKTPLKGHLAWANGDTTGYGIHADFINGWDVDVLHKALNTPACMPNSAITIGDCPVFQPYFDLSAAAACKPALGQMNEVDGAVVDGVPMARLPGCNPLWGNSGSKPGCSSTPQAPNPSHWTGVDQSLKLSSPDKYAVGQAPAFDSNVNKYTSLYCVSSYGGGGTVLSSDMVYYNDPQLSASACQQLCLKSGFVYSAVGNRNNAWQCQCGSALNPNAAIYPNMCTADCPGKSSESCGGTSLTLEIYYNPKPQIQTGSLGYYGCYRNPNNAASGMQSGATYHVASNSMTNDICTSTCKSRGNRWAMTYRKTECFCGDDVNLAGQMFVPDNQGCTSTCAGNSGQICGGTYYASVFAIKDLPLIKTPGQAGQSIATGNSSSSASKISSTAKSSAKASSTSIARSSSSVATRPSSSSSKVTTTSKATVSSSKATSTVNTKTTSTSNKAAATSSKPTTTSTTRATTAATSRSSSSSRSVLPARGSAVAANAMYVNNVVQPSVTESDQQYPPSPTDTSSAKGSTCKPNARHRRRARAVNQM